MIPERTSVRRGDAGFTLIEIMVVMTIIGLLMALVGPRFMRAVVTAERKAALAQIKLFDTALATLRMEAGRYPTGQEGLLALIQKPGSMARWDGPYLQDTTIPKDPWGRAFVYRSPGEGGRPYEVLSFGADGAPGGDGENADVTG